MGYGSFLTSDLYNLPSSLDERSEHLTQGLTFLLDVIAIRFSQVTDFVSNDCLCDYLGQ